MLRHLHVQNLAVIAEASIEFGQGLNILTGETGAGKSIVVDSLALLSGSRASSDLIRSTTDRLLVTGVFEPAGDGWRKALDGAGIEALDDELVVRREVSREGRNRVFINDRPVTLGLLSQVAPFLIRIHTQREELGLVAPDLQRAWLDRVGGEEGQRQLEEVRSAFESYREASARLAMATDHSTLRSERVELLEFQCREIDAAELRAGEEEELRQERELLRHSESIVRAVGGAYGLLVEEDGAASDRLAQAERLLDEVSIWDSRSGEMSESLANLRVAIEELATELRQRLGQIDNEPGRLDAVEDRLQVIERLLRKFGSTSHEVLATRERFESELEELRGATERREELEELMRSRLEEYRAAATELSAARHQWARRLEEGVRRELIDLAMSKARFSVEIGRRRSSGSRLTVDGECVEFGAAGFDQVVYRLAANPGEPEVALASAASGGELSRIYLAVQLASRPEDVTDAPTLVFDEVDAGIGGAQAAALGRKLQRLSRGGQILAVTHLAQVASHADGHFRVLKQLVEGRTDTSVLQLAERERTEEVARMMAGEKITRLSLSHAQELIAASKPNQP